MGGRAHSAALPADNAQIETVGGCGRAARGARHRLTYYIEGAEISQRNVTSGLLRTLGLTYPQLAMLMMVAARPGQSGADLARQLGVTPQSAGEMISLLLRRGLLERHSHPVHGRIRTVSPSFAARSMLAGIETALVAIESRLILNIPEADLVATRRTLAAIIRNGEAGNSG